MKRRLISTAALLLTSSLANATDLFYENFETGGGSFVLNSEENSGMSAAQSSNEWVINNAYAGGTGSYICLGFSFPFVVADVATQPAAITNAPTSNYLHMVSDAARSNGIPNANYVPADGTCFFTSISFAMMAQDVATGAEPIRLSFWWLGGGSSQAVGELFYSTDGGTAWSPVTVPFQNYQGQTTWTQQTISLPEWSNRATLRFGFRFTNLGGVVANDPGFGVDEVRVTVMADALFSSGFEN